MADEKLKSENIELTGRLITSVDGTQLAKGDFQELSNMRYTNTSVKAITGMSKINTSAVTEPVPGSAIHFVKDFPAESHLLYQGIAANGSTSSIYDHTTAIPSQGSFTSLKALTGVTKGKFIGTPDGSVCFGNDSDLLIWGGNENRCAGFIAANTDGTTTPTKIWDYTDDIVDGDATTTANFSGQFVHVASTKRIKGIKFYVSTPNTTVDGSVNVYYWSGSAWVAVSSLVDGTAVSGKSLAQTGTISFSSTDSTAKVKYFNNTIAYWYLVVFTGANIVTNGTFTTDLTGWSGANWAWNAGSGGKALHSAGATTALIQGAATVTIGTIYERTFDTIGRTAGTITASAGGVTGTAISADATTIREFFTATATTAIAFTPTTTFDGAIDNVTLKALSNPAVIKQVTVSADWQELSDLWDGGDRAIASCIYHELRDTSSYYTDISTKVFEKDYVSGASQTYNSTFISNAIDVGLLYNSTAEIYIGFSERVGSLKFELAGTIATTYYGAVALYLKYWDGDSWASITTGLSDGTVVNGYTMGKSGVIQWTPPAASAEFKTSINGNGPFYYYQLGISAAVTSMTVAIDKISGIPISSIDSPANVKAYKFPTVFQNRLCLCNNQSSEANTILIGASNTNCVFNGADSTKLFFGDDRGITAAAPFFSRFSNNFFENLIVFKPDSVWVVDGNTTDTFKTFKIASIHGCAAPRTLTSCDIGFSGGDNTATRNILIWQASNAICIFDGSVVVPIHFDIEDVFDQTKDYAIEPSMISQSTAFFDEVNREWHWLWASAGETTLNKEYVFDVIRKKWYTVDRGTGNRLQLGVSVMDTNNNRYTYGATTDGYIKRLENGQTFDSTAITSSFKTGDAPLSGWGYMGRIRTIKPIFKSKNTTTNDLQLSYYGDTGSTALATLTFDVTDATHRVKQMPESIAKGDFTFHSFKQSMTTSDEDCGHEPIGIAVLYKDTREDTNRG